MNTVLKKSKIGVVSLLLRGLYKITIGRMKYGRRDGYDAKNYWRDRFLRYGDSLKGSGDEGLSVEDNQQMYDEAAEIFVNWWNNERMNSRQNIRVLEIGCGTGFYTEILYNLGVTSYLGVDITDVLFHSYTKKFPGFQFSMSDITKDEISGQYDIVVMIDVIEHIVNKNDLVFAIKNVKSVLAKDGYFLVSPISQKRKRHFFYLHTWTLEDLQPLFVGYKFSPLIPFRDNSLLVIKN